MRKIILLAALAAFTLSVQAEIPEKKPSCKGFVSNGFWDNWEVSVGAGAGTVLSNGKNLGALGSRIGFEGNVAALKWIHPVAGVRMQMQGGYFSNYDATKGKMRWPYIFVHSDFMLNFSNWAGGYREDRAYYLVPFFGFGYMASNFTDLAQQNNGGATHQDIAATYGLLNKFRLSPSFDFNIELKGLIASSKMCPAQMNGKYLFGFSATAGFSYRFNRRGWNRCGGYSADDIRAFQEAVDAGNAALAAAQAENARLSEQLAAAEAKAAANEPVAAAPVAATTEPTAVIFYDYGLSTLDAKAKTRLDVIAQQIKAGPSDKVYAIVGHADQQTGTPSGNLRVSENRAKRVYDYLVAQGVDGKQLTYEGKGDTQPPFDIQKANRSAVIE